MEKIRTSSMYGNMNPIQELLNECNEFIEENPTDYGLELTVKEVKIIIIGLKIMLSFKGGEPDAGN